jgi:predicted permease
MRFRVTHLLVLMLFVAGFGTALALHSAFTVSVVVFLTWLIYASLAWWALVDPARRVVIFSALIFGPTYLLIGLYFWSRMNLPSYFSEIVVSMIIGRDEVGDRNTTLECMWSLIFAACGAVLGASRARRRDRVGA